VEAAPGILFSSDWSNSTENHHKEQFDTGDDFDDRAFEILIDVICQDSQKTDHVPSSCDIREEPRAVDCCHSSRHPPIQVTWLPNVQVDRPALPIALQAGPS
jgi:hypothetical protein